MTARRRLDTLRLAIEGILIACVMFAIVLLGLWLISAAHAVEVRSPRIAVIGDSIALGIGEHLCRALPNCHVHAAIGRISAQTVRHVDIYADIIIVSICTNDPTPSECARNITIIRQNAASDTKFFWIIPVWPQWAHDMITATASGFADGSITFKPGCCSVQKRRHPANYKVLADDVRLAIGR